MQKTWIQKLMFLMRVKQIACRELNDIHDKSRKLTSKWCEFFFFVKQHLFISCFWDFVNRMIVPFFEFIEPMSHFIGSQNFAKFSPKFLLVFRIIFLFHDQFLSPWHTYCLRHHILDIQKTWLWKTYIIIIICYQLNQYWKNYRNWRIK